MPRNNYLSQLVADYIREYNDLGSRTLAKLIYSKHPDIFENDEQVRSKIRYHRGAKGERNRKQIKDKSLMKEAKKYSLPESSANQAEYYPYHLPKDCRNILLLGDLHIPYQDNDALRCALDYGLENKVDTIVLNGDIIDFYQVSSFAKKPTKPSIKYEVDCLTNFLDTLREIFPTQKIYYKEGNHEERWYKYLFQKAPELYGMTIMELDEIFGMSGRGITYIKNKRVIKAGKLNIVHGHEFGHQTFSPVNPARGLYMRSKTNTICGHHHQTSGHTEPNLNEDMIACWSMGCLSTLYAEYAPKPFNKWNHGFAHIKVKKSGDFHVDNFRIRDGKII